MTFSNEEKIQCVTWLHHSKSPTQVQRSSEQDIGNMQHPPASHDKKKMVQNLRTDRKHKKTRIRKTTVDQEKIIEAFQENPKLSLRRASHSLGVSFISVMKALKKAGFKVYRPRIVQALKDEDHEARVKFAESVLYAPFRADLDLA